MANVLIVANRTVGGRALLEAVRERHQEGTRFHLVVPLLRPRHGNVIYDDAARDAANLRIELATMFLRQAEGIELSAEVGDEDPFTATLDALHDFPADEIIISTLPETRSGWLRRGLVERIEEDTGRPVTHVVTDPDEGLVVGVTLVVANRTAGGDELMEILKQEASEGENRIFIAIIPQEGGDGKAAAVARRRLHLFLARLRENGVLASGMIGDPDPYDAIQNALDLFTVDHVVISTLPRTKSGWLRGDLVDRVRGGTNARVDHVEVSLEGAPV